MSIIRKAIDNNNPFPTAQGAKLAVQENRLRMYSEDDGAGNRSRRVSTPAVWTPKYN